ncbi:MAG: hypothetical protein K8J08_00795 [Thermoanaerobaculia bacterium]|nr:hypothetical protein [Thermoanaerobaculia bacterium]
MYRPKPVLRYALPALGLLLLGLAVLPRAAAAGEVSKNVPFELGQWVELGVTDGPVTLHRIRLRRVSGGLTKSKFFRPGNDEFLETVQIQIEYSNASSEDWEVDLDVRWVDSKGATIDGYRDDEDLNDSETHADATVTLSTLKYGLDQAAKLLVDLHFDTE